MNEDRAIHLEGRISALELLMRGVLTTMFQSAADPLEALEEGRRDFAATGQMLDRPVGQHSDSVWEATVKAVNHELDQVRIRLIDCTRQDGAPD